ncbi:hypothetical protein PTSG_02061 [Salpingoeca rosetta]|uniref:TNFR-Cys domain-containing protein n=1 Tax=Salpingoeca rosetta (strain ATCC 50818 / BSB-021) TaxID=946362 RepID=F2TZS1_SALR5|nr:uncharacterized protein PTSG_02061 [Salpingoeca rosetta]EGD79095.1 hypothetical protein PTSG_02061 [Salpingoeca rosetta]|eukprot:XP_004998051.1 hypothetical protein PTSG_02061 [Salpingoeca rosetta]
MAAVGVGMALMAAIAVLTLAVGSRTCAASSASAAGAPPASCNSTTLRATFGPLPPFLTFTSCEDVDANATCTVGCDGTQRYTGTAATLRCENNGTAFFSGQLPICHPPCVSSSEDVDDSVAAKCSEVAVGDSCVWECTRGYQGDSVLRVCVAANHTASSFTGQLPTCDPVPCFLSVDMQGEAYNLADCAIGQHHGDICTASCATGYAGQATTFICDDGSFVGRMPSCTLKRPRMTTDAGSVLLGVYDEQAVNIAYFTDDNTPNAKSGRVLTEREIEDKIASAFEVDRDNNPVEDAIVQDIDSSGGVRDAVQRVIDANSPTGATLTNYLQSTEQSLGNKIMEETDAVETTLRSELAGKAMSLETQMDNALNAVANNMEELQRQVRLDFVEAAHNTSQRVWSAATSLETQFNAAITNVQAEVTQVSNHVGAKVPSLEQGLQGLAADIGGVDSRVAAVSNAATAISDQVNRCLRTCPAGQYVSSWCTSTSPNACSPCPADTFSRGTGLDTTCAPCPLTTCPAGTYAQSCNAATGASLGCATCPSNTYQDEDQHVLRQCKPCSCPSGWQPLGSCVRDQPFKCVQNYISVFDGACGANAWLLTGKAGGCYTSSTHSGTYVSSGDIGGDDFDVYATARVRFAAGRYRFFCSADDCCWISLRGPTNVSPINPSSCNGCTSCSGHTAYANLAAGEYTVMYRAHERGGGFGMTFYIDRA